jgi:hypothetical protein
MLVNELKSHDWISDYSEDFAEFLPEDIQRTLEQINVFCDEESDNISYLVSELFDNLHGWVKAGAIAHTIKYKKVYQHAKIGITNFKQFCQQILKRSVGSINHLIEGAFIVVSLAKAGFSVLPQSAAQACLLAKFAKVKPDVDDYYAENCQNLVTMWQRVLDKVPPHELSALKIAEIVDPDYYQQKKPKFKLSEELRQKLVKKAAQCGLKPEELLEQLIDNFAPEPEVEPAAEEAETTPTTVKPKLPYRFPSITSLFPRQRREPVLIESLIPF